ncbi:histidine phosphatase family protein [Rhizobium sp. BK376]|uniref:SixA phosphatase family protein n=1 Tax=Rhizobium sp. BK376 TaxID=2512149 RepID=UPI0010503B53|nr:histidine phosphatase family protein [Rhizobium sp. BK376]TCR84008.1 phosphohistidine phosphatase [Rhizobium sp. BK376]
MTSISPPPFRIYLLRHAKALSARPGERDFDRALSDRGYGDAEIMADKAADKGYVPDLVISSTALRCRQTAEAIRRVAGPDVEFRFVDELYNASADGYLNIIASQATDNSVMLVGHNPVISQTLASLIGQSAATAALPSGFPTAGLAVIDAERNVPAAKASWTLTDFISD